MREPVHRRVTRRAARCRPGSRPGRYSELKSRRASPGSGDRVREAAPVGAHDPEPGASEQRSGIGEHVGVAEGQPPEPERSQQADVPRPIPERQRPCRRQQCREEAAVAHQPGHLGRRRTRIVEQHEGHRADHGVGRSRPHRQARRVGEHQPAGRDPCRTGELGGAAVQADPARRERGKWPAAAPPVDGESAGRGASASPLVGVRPSAAEVRARTSSVMPGRWSWKSARQWSHGCTVQPATPAP